MKFWFPLILFLFSSAVAFPQASSLMYRPAMKEYQDKMHRNLIQNTINKNLGYTLGDSTEDNWQDAFQAMEVLQYKSPWVQGRLNMAAVRLGSAGISFQRMFLEMAYSLYPKIYTPEVQQLLLQTTDPKIFAMCAVYLYNSDNSNTQKNYLGIKTNSLLQQYPANPILLQLSNYIQQNGKSFAGPIIKAVMAKNYLPGNVLLISFQRADRNYPGLVVVRDGNGNFVKDSLGNYFSVPQLARSGSNMPGFLTNGNTPQGLFRLEKFDVSVSTFIGPTPNLQLSMPFEKKAFHFFKTNNEADTSWSLQRYLNLLPADLRTNPAMQESWYAGMAGRSEIIAHGSTINPEWYTSQPYYPLTPTQGCLTSKENWSRETGKRIQSDQQKLIYAVLAAGGANGYVLVINIDDEKRSVNFSDIEAYLKSSR
ncbi:MAG: hypothetical protein ABIT96_09850 [Ferruginibacter sp.]